MKKSTEDLSLTELKKGFTLAEVLITLVIIGVIGALTVPALIQNTQKQEYVSALKKTYSTLSQVTNQIIAEKGTPRADAGGWAVSGAEIQQEYNKRLNNAKVCSNGKKRCIIKNGTRYYKYLNGNSYTDDFAGDALILANGAQLVFGWISQSCGNVNWGGSGSYYTCALILADTNGAKGPNTFGRDVFMLALKENGLYPAGCDLTWKTCIDNGSGFGCACKVLTDDAMNY